MVWGGCSSLGKVLYWRARACNVRPNIEHETFFLLYDVQVLASSLVLRASRRNLTSMAHRWLLFKGFPTLLNYTVTKYLVRLGRGRS